MIEEHQHAELEKQAEVLRHAGYSFRITHRTIEVKCHRKPVWLHENYPESQSGSVPRAEYEADCANNMRNAIAAAQEHYNERLKAFHRAQLENGLGQ